MPLKGKSERVRLYAPRVLAEPADDGAAGRRPGARAQALSAPVSE